ncbi:Tetratricopeptide-like helical domain containing protein [Parasponia andersonii]|uniref:Tetratricopeptide-like helical domain containing protein n=1 Tax=Parasponia andersonii TaxID=3476 RepID=A0A2P5DTN6_PARAD|nr:Tetratricopeptide-like helical domain containing protein [Parasponia andersonii]
MATLQSALLPSRPLFTDSSLRKPNSVRLLNFSALSSTTSFTSYSVNSTSKQKIPRAHLSLSAENTKILGHYPGAENQFEISLYLLSLLDNEFVYDYRQVHALAVKLNAFEVDCWIGNKLAMLYSKNKELLDYARDLFDEIPKRNRPGYSSLISAYCRSEQWEDLFLLLGLMIDEGLLPDKYLVPTVLKACSALKLSRNGKMLHGYVTRKDLNSDIFVGNSLIDLYANCGDLRSSRSVFDAMREKDVVSWTTLVTAYMDVGLLDEGNEVFYSMQLNGVKPDLISWNAFVSGFARNGEIDLALQHLEEMKQTGVKPRVNTWNGIISGCVQNKYFEDALDAFYSMLLFPETPNFVTIASILPACAGLENLDLGRAFHGFALRRQLCGNVHVEGSLIDMYSKCGRNNYAVRVFDKAENKNTAMWNEMIAAFVNEGKMKKAFELLRLMQNNGPKPDVISFNTMLAGHARNGQKDEAYELLAEMVQTGLSPNIVSYNVLISGFQQSGLSYEALKLFQTLQSPSDGCFLSDVFIQSVQPNSITTTSALAACAALNLKHQGKEIHGYTLRNGFERNAYVSGALVHVYSKCCDTVSAAKVFRRIGERNTICWNALIAGHVNNMQPDVALKLFCEMLAEAVEPSSVTLMILLLACGDMAALRSGRELHGYVLKSRLDESDIKLASALISMYTKCGSITEAKSVFNSEVKEDVSVWNAMMNAYLVFGIAMNAITLFEQLELGGILPDN